MHLPPGTHARVQFDFAERRFVAGDVLLQQSQKRLGLLRAEIDALKVTNLHLSFALLLHRAEDQEEIPNVDSHLNAVGIRFPIIGGVSKLDIGLWRNTHRKAV